MIGDRMFLIFLSNTIQDYRDPPKSVAASLLNSCDPIRANRRSSPHILYKAMAIALTQVVVKRCRGDRSMAHRNADLVERHDDVAGGIDPCGAGPLLGIDHDAAIVTQRQAEGLGEVRRRGSGSTTRRRPLPVRHHLSRSWFGQQQRARQVPRPDAE